MRTCRTGWNSARAEFLFLYKQNHAFDAWFQKGFTVEQKNSFCYTWNAVCQLQSKKEKEDIHEHE